MKWLRSNAVLLPGVTTVARLVSRVVGNYTFSLPDLGEAGIRPLRDPDAPDDDDD